jgi:hypothetical protein
MCDNSDSVNNKWNRTINHVNPVNPTESITIPMQNMGVPIQDYY